MNLLGDISGMTVMDRKNPFPSKSVVVFMNGQKDMTHQQLEKLTPKERWKIAIDLYTSESVSMGHAAELAGLNTFVFMDKMQERGVPFIAPEPATEEEKERENTLLNELFDFSKL